MTRDGFVARRFPLSRACLLLALCLAGTVGAAAAKEGAHGVEWYEGLTLGDARAADLAGWKALLSRPWMQHDEAVTFALRHGAERASVDTCRALSRALEQGMHPVGPDRAIVYAWSADCHAIRILAAATSPETDHIGEVALTRDVVEALPVGIAFVISPDEQREVARIQASGGQLGDVLGAADIEPLKGEDGHAVRITDAGGGTQVLRALARGDFDHDGTADLMLSSDNAVSGGTYRTSHLYIVSRLHDDGPWVLRRDVAVMGAGVD